MQKIKTKPKNKKGFTLIEMLVVIGIIGLLSTVLLVSVSRIRKNSIDTRRKANLENVRGATSMYYSAKSSWPTFSSWATLVSALSTSGYISDNIPADEDGDSLNDYSAETCTSPCQIKLCSACELDGEGCTNSVGGDTRKWYCLEVK